MTDADKPGVHVVLKRAYTDSQPGDGYRVLVDRLWPRGLSKGRAHIDCWLKDVAPSAELRKWFGHDPQRFAEFGRRYTAELDDVDGVAHGAADRLLELCRVHECVTLVFAAKDEDHNSAVVLRKYVLSRLR